MASKIRLLSKGEVRVKYSLPMEVVSDNILRRTKPEGRKLLNDLSVSDFGKIVNSYLGQYLNSEIHAKPSVITKYYRDLQQLIINNKSKIEINEQRN